LTDSYEIQNLDTACMHAYKFNNSSWSAQESIFTETKCGNNLQFFHTTDCTEVGPPDRFNVTFDVGLLYVILKTIFPTNLLTGAKHLKLNIITTNDTTKQESNSNAQNTA